MTEVTKTRDDIIKQAHELALEYRAKYGGAVRAHLWQRLMF